MCKKTKGLHNSLDGSSCKTCTRTSPDSSAACEWISLTEANNLDGHKVDSSLCN